ncbi:MAG: AEC family transporter [Clostridia bacterium]|nr:AEC family transporter [Clostridia bacterium]
MESLKLSFDAIAPIFLLMLLGYVLKCLKIADKKGFDLINKLVFKAFLPTLLFYNIYKTETANVFDPKLVAFTSIGILFVFIVGYFTVLVLTKENPKRGVMLQGFFRTNFAILGIPLVSYICGEQARGLASLMVAIIIPMFNILAVIALERFRGGSGKLHLPTLLKGMAKNPLIIGCVIGLVFFGLDIKLPYVIEKSVGDIASIATPLAIIALGAGFEFSGIKGYAKEISIVIIARLVVIPIIILTAAVLCGFSGEALACLLITFGGPIAVSSFSMAQQMDGDEKLAAQIVVISSALCLFTLFLWIFGLNSLGLFTI